MRQAPAPKPPAKAKGAAKPPPAKSSKLSGTRRTVAPLKKSTAKPVVVEARKLSQPKTKTEKDDDDDDDGFEDVDIPDNEFEKIVAGDLYADDDDDNDNGEVDDAENAGEDEEEDDDDDDDDDDHDETGNDEVEDLTHATLGQESSESGEDAGGDDNDVLDELAMQDAIVTLDARERFCH
ncbi:hypothetical protein HDU83_009552 [Entophlyctis luteolus]|nr:hypothetical protein HDU83_009552 [Entophlyctis luteolus]